MWIRSLGEASKRHRAEKLIEWGVMLERDTQAAAGSTFVAPENAVHNDNLIWRRCRRADPRDSASNRFWLFSFRAEAPGLFTKKQIIRRTSFVTWLVSATSKHNPCAAFPPRFPHLWFMALFQSERNTRTSLVMTATTEAPSPPVAMPKVTNTGSCITRGKKKKELFGSGKTAGAKCQFLAALFLALIICCGADWIQAQSVTINQNQCLQLQRRAMTMSTY